MHKYRMRMAGKSSAEIFIYSEIGGYFGGINANDFVKDLAALGKVDTLNVRINSPGGDVYEGLPIYNALKRHPAVVNVDVDGMAFSIASVIAMAGDTIRMAKNAMMMVHETQSGAWGTAEDLRRKADLMDTVTSQIIDIYVARTGESEADIRTLISEETWMTASEALAKGFADEVTEELDMAAHFDLSRFDYHRAPRSLVASQRARAGESRTPWADAARGRIAQMSADRRKIG